jgi:hypothetical protein
MLLMDCPADLVVAVADLVLEDLGGLVLLVRDMMVDEEMVQRQQIGLAVVVALERQDLLGQLMVMAAQA